MKQFIQRVKTSFPFLALAVAFIWSGLSIAQRKSEEVPPNKKVIRLGHWQLEPGIRDAFEKLARQYEELHPDVKIIQDAIPDQSYSQWLTTQLIGGNAPDIVEAGQLPGNLLTTFYLRYFLPLTPLATKPNPYNVNTEFEDVPFFQTFRDGLRSAFIDEAQEFMDIPLSAVSVRIFYNKDLLKRLTGLDAPPSNYREFLKVCDQIAKQTSEDGTRFVPIAASAYHVAMWDSAMFMPATYLAIDDLDFTADGLPSKEELFIGFSTGRIGMKHPAYQARLKLLADLTPYFPAGYTGLNRDDAVMMIAKQKAVMVSIGTWDASSLFEQAKGRFEAGFIDFPLPTSDDPEYGKFFPGPRWEQVQGGNLPFAVTRTSKHPEIAMDFLLFLTSQKKNEEFNKMIGWIPAIRGAKTSDWLHAFEPNYVGVYAAFDPSIGAESTVRWIQLFSLYRVGQISLEDFSKEFEVFYKEKGKHDFQEFLREKRRGILRDEQLAVRLRVAAMDEAPLDQSALPWIRYRKVSFSRILNAQFYTQALEADAEKGKLSFFREPNTYSKTALKRIKSRVSSGDLQGN